MPRTKAGMPLRAGRASRGSWGGAGQSRCKEAHWLGAWRSLRRAGTGRRPGYACRGRTLSRNSGCVCSITRINSLPVRHASWRPRAVSTAWGAGSPRDWEGTKGWAQPTPQPPAPARTELHGGPASSTGSSQVCLCAQAARGGRRLPRWHGHFRGLRRRAAAPALMQTPGDGHLSRAALSPGLMSTPTSAAALGTHLGHLGRLLDLVTAHESDYRQQARQLGVSHAAWRLLSTRLLTVSVLWGQPVQELRVADLTKRLADCEAAVHTGLTGCGGPLLAVHAAFGAPGLTHCASCGPPQSCVCAVGRRRVAACRGGQAARPAERL